ncbi:hypothetical protein ACHHYP_20307 [Achlya hypogyna]|uniref:Uncharacterized protein n=1 Tax=Achlya hypogyna TaxID=1202772 RepID=A0A1V9YRB6_ACHHY|nr:hypothetical protein ACHHYP_20307 [Achlya hypogyna]
MSVRGLAVAGVGLLLLGTTFLLLAMMHPMLKNGHVVSSNRAPVLALGATGERLAYMLYATNTRTACNALIMAKRIRQLGTPTYIDIVLLAANTIVLDTLGALHEDGTLILKFVDPWIQHNAKHPTWSASLTKLRIFDDHGYDRVIYLDSDAWLHRNLDHLFSLGNAVVWGPRAYYEPQHGIASTLLVLRPSSRLFSLIQTAVDIDYRNDTIYDMDVINRLWKDDAGVLPSHYVVLNSDLNSNKTFGFGSVAERINETYVTHFSTTPDGKYGKPWKVLRAAVVRNPAWHPRFYALFEAYWQSQARYCKWLNNGH